MSAQAFQLDLLAGCPKKLAAHEEALRNEFAEALKSASLFLMAFDSNDASALRCCNALSEEIALRLKADVERIPLARLACLGGTSDNLFLQRLVIRNVSPENAKKEIENAIQSRAAEDKHGKPRVRLSQFGLFIPRLGTITCRSFAHGQGHYYRFRTATFKLDKVPMPLREFLSGLQSNCPDRYFMSGPRASSFEAAFAIPMTSSAEHPMVRLSQEGLRVRKLKSAHEDLEKHLLDCDAETIACEVPIWFEPSELGRFAASIPKPGDTLTGHIDILRYEQDGRIGIWDYKPSAAEESKANVQVYLYALMLSKRTGLAIDRFRCGYFDSSVAFWFSPEGIPEPSV